MICHVCGSEIEDNATICPVCGAEQKVQKEAPRRIVRSQENTERLENLQKKTENAAKVASRVVKDVAAATAGGAKVIKNNIEDSVNTERIDLNDIPRDIQKTSNGMQKIGGFVLAENEIVIKSYLCALLGSGLFVNRTNTGYLIVTNQRVLYEGKDNRSRIAMETPIETVGSIRAYNGVNFNTTLILIGAILVIYGLFSMSNRSVLTGFLALITGVILLIMSYRKAYMLSIYSNSVSSSAITVGEGPKTVFGNEAFYTLNAAPTSETNKMMSEIGALIKDVQTLGNRAIEKWQNS